VGFLTISHDMTAYEDLQIANLVKHHHLARSINDAAWGSSWVGSGTMGTSPTCR